MSARFRTVPVRTASRAYDVHVGSGILDDLGTLLGEVAPNADAAFVVTDSNVGPLYLERALSALAAAGFSTASVTVPAGEENKNLATYGLILDAMAHAELTRDSIVVALGGGVVGDMAGFAAATYMRGIHVVQVPTTLLSMVDSSVGGKTAIDVSAGKNLVGAFLQPSLVIADVDTLQTLRPATFTDGMGEVVKHAVLADEQLFDQLASFRLDQSTDADRLSSLVACNVAIKRDVVGADERERGLRQTLNLGHTIGHAIEADAAYQLGHGHCVAAGLCCVARAAEARGWTDEGLARRIEECVATQGLPVDTRADHERIFEQAIHDKKRHGTTVNVVVPTRIGAAEIRTIPLDELRALIDLGCGTSAACSREEAITSAKGLVWM